MVFYWFYFLFLGPVTYLTPLQAARSFVVPLSMLVYGPLVDVYTVESLRVIAGTPGPRRLPHARRSRRRGRPARPGQFA